MTSWTISVDDERLAEALKHMRLRGPAKALLLQQFVNQLLRDKTYEQTFLSAIAEFWNDYCRQNELCDMLMAKELRVRFYHQKRVGLVSFSGSPIATLKPLERVCDADFLDIRAFPPDMWT